MKQYLEALEYILKYGDDREDRTGTGTRSIFGYQMRFNLRESFPLLTTKKLHLRSIIHELIWFLNGDTNIKYLKDNGVSIWDEWANKKGDLGPIYGKQWREFSASGTCAVVRSDYYTDQIPGIVTRPRPKSSISTAYVDQIKEVFESLKNNPNSRRHIVCAWNPLQLSQMALPPCHCLFQFYVNSKKELSCQLYQRSCDFFLGVPFNIASYSLLTHIFADCLNYKVGDFVWTGGDVHLYKNHFEQAKEQLARIPYDPTAQLVIKNHHNYPWEYKYDDFEITDYKAHPSIYAPISV